MNSRSSAWTALPIRERRPCAVLLCPLVGVLGVALVGAPFFCGGIVVIYKLVRKPRRFWGGQHPLLRATCLVACRKSGDSIGVFGHRLSIHCLSGREQMKRTRGRNPLATMVLGAALIFLVLVGGFRLAVVAKRHCPDCGQQGVAEEYEPMKFKCPDCDKSWEIIFFWGK